MEINITNDLCIIERYSDRLICPNCNNEINANCYNAEIFADDITYRELCPKCGGSVYFEVKTLTLFRVDEKK